MKSITVLLALVLAGAVAGEARAQSGQPALAPSQAQAALDVAEARALALLVAMHEHEVDAAARLVGRQVSPAVRAYAQRVSAWHEDRLSATRALALQVGTSPQDTPDVVAFQNSARLERERLDALDVSSLERGYVEATMRVAREVVHAIDTELLPRVTRTETVSHLRLARDELAALAAEGQLLAEQMPAR